VDITERQQLMANAEVEMMNDELGCENNPLEVDGLSTVHVHNGKENR
jgi:hypothetical protein